MSTNGRLKLELASTTAPSPPAAVTLGQLMPGSNPGKLLVDYAGNAGEPLAARTTLRLTPEAVQEAVASDQQALLLFENGDPTLPIVTGLLQASETPLALVPGDSTPAAKEPALYANVDGKRVAIEGEEEVALKCGKASITLKADGRVVLRGAYIETYSRGVNRIKGGCVKIN